MDFSRKVPTTALLALCLTGCGDDGKRANVGDASPPDQEDVDAGAEVDSGAPPDQEEPGVIATQHSRGSAVTLTPDEQTAIIVNRDVGSVSVLAVENGSDTTASLSLRKEISLGEGSEPWQSVTWPSGDAAFVILRRDQKLVRISSLTDAPEVDGEVATGAEPTGVALSPSGRYAYVANLADGTISEIDTRSLTAGRTIDLNQALVDTGYLGDVSARPGLAHPRSLVVTNDLDATDSDETLYVTEYFAQQVEPELADGSNADTRKVGLVYRVALATGEVSTIPLAPLDDMGFLDQNRNSAGCYPNQLQAIELSGDFAYVSSVCASPEGPLGVRVTTTACVAVADCASLNLVEPVCVPAAAGLSPVCVDVGGVKTTTGSLVSVIDTRSGEEVPDSAVNLNASFAALFGELGLAAGAQRFPLFVTDVAFVPGAPVGYFAANGGDAVFRARFSAETGKLEEVGASTAPFLDLAPAGIDAGKAGKNPIGIATFASERALALVANDVSRNASLLDFNTQGLAGGATAPAAERTSALPTTGSKADKILRGKRFFNTGTGRWSLRGQGWGACQSCHSDGLTDNVTWYFPRGPRQSVSLDGSFASTHPEDQRIFNWTGIFDEVADFENNTRGVSGGVGATVGTLSAPPQTSDRIDLAALGHNGLGGSAADAADPANPLALDPSPKLEDWNEIEAYVQSLRSPRAPSNLDAESIARGADLFAEEGSCAGCHGGEKWTISKRFYTPSIATNASLLTTPFAIPSGFPLALLPARTPANQTLRFNGGNAAAFDQIQCAVRPVGTFAVAEDGVGIAELRVDMTTVAQGAGNPAGEGAGYNAPSLLGLNLGAPYLHAGNARTLEALLSDTFRTHSQSLAPNFLTDGAPSAREQKVSDLVSYLLSIDETTPYLAVPPAGARGGSLCPETFP